MTPDLNNLLKFRKPNITTMFWSQMEYPENADPLQDSKHLAAKQMCNCPQVTDKQ